MNRRAILIGAAAVFLATVLIWLLWPREQLPQRLAQEVATPAPAAATPSTPTAALPPTKEEQQQSKQERANTLRSAIEGTNVPINFWGKVVDLERHALSGVAVSYQYQTEHVLLPGVAWARSEVHKGQTTTGADGLFSIEGLRGHSLSISGFSKSGYKVPEKFSPAVATFNYFGDTASGRFIPDKDRPVEFVMISQSAVGSLVVSGGNFGKTLRLAGDGTPLRWNLWTGKKDPNGELQVTFQREPATLTKTGQASRWAAKVEIVGGGILEAPNDAARWQAPEAGYLNDVDYPKTEQKRGTPSRAFYVKTADDKYGRIELELFPSDEGATVRCLIKTQMNPQAGSRTVER